MDESAWRCAECGHGKQLTAWGTASVCGPLGADGRIDSYDWDEVFEVHEDSIQCSAHPGAAIEKLAGGRYCRWWCCPRCDGSGRGGRCPEQGIRSPGSSAFAHSGWWPAGEPLPESTLDRNGHVFTPGRDPCCRHCRVHASSGAIETACKGDDHYCPAIVAPASTPTARGIYGTDDWACLQPGAMNEDFTEWRCAAGHVTTRNSPEPHQAIIFRSPYDVLVAA